MGGSNVAYGIDSYSIAQNLGYIPVNMGLHAGLGLEYYLQEIEDKLGTGDVVVLSLEYEHFVSQQPHLPERLLLKLASRPSNLEYVPAYYLPSLLDKSFVQLGVMLRSTKASIRGDLELDSVFRRSSFNAVGDMIGHHQYEPKDLSGHYNNLSDVTPQTARRAIRMLNEFAEKAEKRGVTVFYSYAPLLQHVFEYNEAAIALIWQELEAGATFKILDRPEDLAWTGDYFFDTEYHLSLEGKQARADHIARRLTEHIAEVAADVDGQSSPSPN